MEVHSVLFFYLIQSFLPVHVNANYLKCIKIDNEDAKQVLSFCVRNIRYNKKCQMEIIIILCHSIFINCGKHSKNLYILTNQCKTEHLMDYYSQ